MIFPKDCCKPIGPIPSDVAFVGEAPGEQEEMTGIPFMGSSGQELGQMCLEVGWQRREIFFTNVLHKRPPSNKLDAWCLPKKEVGKDYYHEPLRTGQYLHPELLPELDRLRRELENAKPNLVVALGATATWALMGTAKITAIRGTISESTLIPGLKVLPTYHPAYVLRSWESRTIVVSDLFKARAESRFSEIRRPTRHLFTEPDISDLAEWEDILLRASILGVDIETSRGQITTIGFAVSPQLALVFPFADGRKTNGSYWEKHSDERLAWLIVQEVLESPIPKVFQNGLYDLQYISRLGFKVLNCLDDTMILSHALWPEMRKDLGFLGSIHTNESSWKVLRNRAKDQTKRDE